MRRAGGSIDAGQRLRATIRCSLSRARRVAASIAASLSLLFCQTSANALTIMVNNMPCPGATLTFNIPNLDFQIPPSCLGAPTLPVITSLSVASAYAGQSVTITGTQLTAGAMVFVGGVQAAIVNANGSTSITFLMPVTALTNQTVVVTVGGQSSAGAPLSALAPPLTLMSVQSRKTHATLGDIDLSIDRTAALHGAVTIEPRSDGQPHRLVLRFDGPVLQPGSAAVVDSVGAPVNFGVGVSGNEIAISLPLSLEGQRIAATVSGVNGGGSIVISMGFLVGDVNGDGVVGAGDVSAVKARSGQALDSTNLRFDLNVSGVIGAADVAAAKVRIGRMLVP
jgi:hypothetical protein